MTSAAAHRPMIDLESLLVPLSSEQPAGEPLRHSGVYDQIKEARRADDPTLPQGVWQTTLKVADWPAVEAACVEVLGTRSKDLQIAAWLLEAWFHLHGLAGVRQGLRLLQELCVRYWDTVYPGLDGGVEARTGPFRWLNDRFAVALRSIAVTGPAHEPSAGTALADWEQAHGDAEEARRAALRESAVLTPREFYTGLLAAVDETLGALQHLEACLREHCGDEAPSLHELRSQLAAVSQLVAALLAEHHHVDDSTSVNAADGADGLNGTDSAALRGGAAAPGLAIRSRAEAYQRLAEVAEYLGRTEPHSPTPYLIRRAAAWGRMPLSDLLEELIRDPDKLRAVYSLLGIGPGTTR